MVSASDASPGAAAPSQRLHGQPAAGAPVAWAVGVGGAAVAVAGAAVAVAGAAVAVAGAAVAVAGAAVAVGGVVVAVDGAPALRLSATSNRRGEAVAEEV